MGRLAVQTGIWPLFEIVNGKFEFSSPSAALVDKTKRKPIEEYVKQQGRFDRIAPEDVEELKRWIDESWLKYDSLRKANQKP
jgi:pyruvate ferredoxin oxidoreductase beta subunit